jgi:hypothetical protein
MPIHLARRTAVNHPERVSAYSRSKYSPKRLGVLAGRDLRRFYVGYAASLLGTARSSVAIAFALLGAGGTATGFGIASTANIANMIAFMLFGGGGNDILPAGQLGEPDDPARASENRFPVR